MNIENNNHTLVQMISDSSRMHSRGTFQIHVQYTDVCRLSSESQHCILSWFGRVNHAIELSFNVWTDLGFESREVDNPALMVCAPLSRTTTEGTSGMERPSPQDRTTLTKQNMTHLKFTCRSMSHSLVSCKVPC